MLNQMKNDKRTIQIICSLVLALIAICNTAQACSCARSSIASRFNNADYVFTATVIGLRLKDEARTLAGYEGDKFGTEAEMLQIEFNPLVDHKGSSSEIDYLYTFRDSATCGVSVYLGAVYTFFVEENKVIGLCGSVLSKEEEQDFTNLISKNRSE